MDRQFAANTSITPPAEPSSPATGYPRNGGVGADPTTAGAYWYHMITESLLNVVVGAGLTPDASDLTLLRQAILALVSAGDADTVDGYHAADLWRFDATSSLKAANGWRITPDGFLEQWGVLEDVSFDQTFHSVTFPVPFGALFNVTPTLSMADVVSGSIGTVIRSLTTAGFEVVGDNSTDAGSGDIYWRALGTPVP